MQPMVPSQKKIGYPPSPSDGISVEFVCHLMSKPPDQIGPNFRGLLGEYRNGLWPGTISLGGILGEGESLLHFYVCLIPGQTHRLKKKT